MHEALQDSQARLKSYFLDDYVQDVYKLLTKYEQLGYFKDL